MKYLLALAIIAGAYYQFYLPKLDEESIVDFMSEIKLADMNKDYETMTEQFSELVLVSQSDRHSDVTSELEMKRETLIKAIKQLKSPKLNLVDKSEIEKIEILEEKALVTSLITVWVTVEGRRIKRVSRETLTIVIQKASLKIREINSHLIKAKYVS